MTKTEFEKVVQEVRRSREHFAYLPLEESSLDDRYGCHVRDEHPNNEERQS